jgi:hypothetical protein
MQPKPQNIVLLRFGENLRERRELQVVPRLKNKK